jgi:hypothetical protein
VSSLNQIKTVMDKEDEVSVHSGLTNSSNSTRSSECTPSLENVEENQKKLVQIYNTGEPWLLNKETLNNIGKYVRNVIVKKIKFIEGENTTGLSKEAAERTKRFPSFWQPDLTKLNSVQRDIFREYPEFDKQSLEVQARAWMGMRTKVKKEIRAHRNNVQSHIQRGIIAGKF